jgi:RimJ/RimL family protein N-acetyltransferase
MSFSTETDRLLLRDLNEEDLPVLIEHFTEPSARHNILSSQSTEAFVKWYVETAIALPKQRPRSGYIWAIILKAENRIIGCCDLWDAVSDGTEAKFGWHLGSRYSGKGYATEAARQMLNIGFGANERQRIFGDCFAHNKAAIRVMEKIGMTRYRSNKLLSWWRARNYGENGFIVRYHLWRNQWLSQNEDQKANSTLPPG